MTKSKGMKTGDLVTLKLDSDASNTYVVVHYLVGKDEYLLEHPTIPGVCISKPREQLNTVQAQLKNSTEKCLDYVKENRDYLGYNDKIQLEELFLYHVVNKKFSPRQKQELATLCGIVANIYCNHDINIAIRIVKENEGLLDDFNFLWYSNLRGFFEGKERAVSKSQKNSIFNITGFVLAQLMEIK